MQDLIDVFSDLKVDFPATVLICMAVALVWVLWRAQKREDFDLAQMLQDDKGQASSARLAMFVCLGISSWVIMALVWKTGQIDTWVFLGYAGIWSGAKAVDRFIDAYIATKGQLPSRIEQTDTTITSSTTEVK